MIKIYLGVSLLITTAYGRSEKIVFQDDFNEFDMEKWQHELTLGGGGNWEF